MAQHQGGHVAHAAPAFHVAHGQLDLRQRLHRVHAGDQRAQRHQHGAHVRRQHAALLHVGHIAALAFVKAHQHRALFAHVLDREARPVAVAPGRALNGAQDVVGLDLADVPQVVLQHPLLDGHLRTHMQVLHLAAATGALVQAKVRALGAHPLRRLGVDLGQRALLETVFGAVYLRADHLKRQCAVNKDHFAIGFVGHTLGFEVQGFHFEPALGQRFFNWGLGWVRVCHA